MRQERLRFILGGESRSLSAKIARAGLRCLEPAYRMAIDRRNTRFDQKHGVSTVAVPVISIGNITTGGTGKTPLVRWTIEQLRQFTARPAIVSRGYGSQAGEPNDEFLELKSYLPDITHVQDPDRIAAAQRAIGQNQATAIVLDDGFQHRRLARDLDIVLIDLTCPFGYEHLLPRGLLREPIESLARADAFVLTRRSRVSDQVVQNVLRRLAPYAVGKNGFKKPIAQVSFVADQWISLTDSRAVLRLNQDQPTLAFCGIGNSGNYFQSLRSQLNEIRDEETFPDHYQYSQADLSRLEAKASSIGATAMVCTMKDLVKLKNLRRPSIPVYANSIRTDFVQGVKELVELLEKPFVE